MTQEVAPAVFVIHEVAAVREAIQGGNAAMNSIIGPIFVTPADRRCPREERPRKGVANHGVKSISPDLR
jgi:hypothetical protein